MEKPIILHQTPLDQLTEAVSRQVIEEIKSIIPAPPEEVEYLTRREAADLLKITLVTLNSWTKKGILKSCRISNRIRYKKSEIHEALKIVPNLKYRRNQA